MKTSILNLRLDTSIRAALDEIGVTKNKSASAITRDAIDFYLKQNNPDLPDTSILQTFGFAELIYWIMDKHFDPEALECHTLYKKHVKLISEMENNPLFTEDLMIELRKVQKELIDHLNDQNEFAYFQFPNDGGFDYSVLNGFMHIVRFDDNDEVVIHIK